MPRLLTIGRGSAMPLLVAATVISACSGAGDTAADTRTSAPSDTSTTSATTRATPRAELADETSADQTSGPDDLRFVCPEGGVDEVIALQDAVDQGHQPWRLFAQDVAAACTFGISQTSIEPTGVDRYRVTHLSTGESAIVELAQPLGPNGIWVVTSVTSSSPTTTADAAACSAEAILPAVRQELEPDAGVPIVAVIVRECRNGYARVTAEPDNSTCGEPGGSCLESEQVFLTATGAGWSYLSSGTGISCATDHDLFSGLLTACEELGLR